MPRVPATNGFEAWLDTVSSTTANNSSVLAPCSIALRICPRIEFYALLVDKCIAIMTNSRTLRNNGEFSFITELNQSSYLSK